MGLWTPMDNMEAVINGVMDTHGQYGAVINEVMDTHGQYGWSLMGLWTIWSGH